jgi:hypothetical protein
VFEDLGAQDVVDGCVLQGIAKDVRPDVERRVPRRAVELDALVFAEVVRDQ